MGGGSEVQGPSEIRRRNLDDENLSEVWGGNGKERMEVRDVLKVELITAADLSWGRSMGEVKDDGCLAANRCGF